MAIALRHNFETNGRILFNPLCYAAGAAAFGLSSIVLEMVEPVTAAAFGLPIPSVAVFVYYSLECLGNTPAGYVARAALAAFAAIAAGTLMANGFGFTITLAESALFTLVTLIFWIVVIGVGVIQAS